MGESEVTEKDVFILSENALADVFDQIRPEQWSERKPEWFQAGRLGDATLREIVNYHAYDTAWVPEVLAGKTIVEVGDVYEHLKTDSECDYRALSKLAVEAARNLAEPDGVVHLSYGDFPAREYLKHITSFRGFRVYDVAKWIGVDTTMPPALVQGMWDELEPDMDTWREMGVYGPEVVVASDATLQDRLLGRAGRDPRPATGVRSG
jgi:hypothetical protein